tara:strand:- start:704 stop:919 length:216 start_codon:yes stop_codon:yes gene_type:complete
MIFNIIIILQYSIPLYIYIYIYIYISRYVYWIGLGDGYAAGGREKGITQVVRCLDHSFALLDTITPQERKA